METFKDSKADKSDRSIRIDGRESGWAVPADEERVRCACGYIKILGWLQIAKALINRR
jgi:hypothetical protein